MRTKLATLALVTFLAVNTSAQSAWHSVPALLYSDGVPVATVSGDNAGEEAAVWNSIKDTNNVDVLKAFIRSYPNGTFATIAKSLIDVLEAKQTAPTATIETSNQEKALWNSVKSAKSPADLQPYLDAYPNGRYAALVKARIATLGAAQTITAAVAPDTPAEPASETATQTAALAIPEKEINPFDGKWRLSGAAHSFKRYRGGICQNPDSLNDSFVVTDGRIDDVLKSKSRNTVAIEGDLDSTGQLNIDFRSKNHGWDYNGKASATIKQNAATVSFQVRLQGASQSGCRYDFTMRRVE